MSFVAWMETALELLDTDDAPGYIRDTLKVDAEGQTVIPDDPQHIILDLITAAGSYSMGQTGRGSIADSVVLQVGAWARTAAQSYDLADEARAKLEPEHWEMVSLASQSEGQWRGCLATYRKLF